VASDFLAKVCLDWENEANKARNHQARVAIIRVGIVLGHGGGALAQMLPIFKLGGGGPLGSGKQYMS
jgi:NAD dependent epimerase/dehydratase family enzyme